MENPKVNILVIDDDKSILNIFTRVLQKQGYNIDTAETGQETVEKLQNRNYDVALVDIKLPDTNGIDLIARMHATHPKTIKIAITGFPSLEEATKIMDQGAAAYLVKPAKSDVLIGIIAEKLKSREDKEKKK